LRGDTGEVLWTVPAARIEAVHWRSPLILVRVDGRGCSVINRESGAVVWNSAALPTDKAAVGNVFCTLDEDGSHLLIASGKKLYWIGLPRH
jgi:hypothetical protein